MPGEHLAPARTCGRGSVVEHHLAKVRVAGSNPVVRSEVPDAVSPADGPHGSSVPWHGSRTGGATAPGQEHAGGGMAEWLRQGPAKPCTRVRFPLPPRGRLAQRESASLTRKRSLVQSQYRPPGQGPMLINTKINWGDNPGTMSLRAASVSGQPGARPRPEIGTRSARRVLAGEVHGDDDRRPCADRPRDGVRQPADDSHQEATDPVNPALQPVSLRVVAAAEGCCLEPVGRRCRTSGQLQIHHRDAVAMGRPGGLSSVLARGSGLRAPTVNVVDAVILRG